ncbi:hypothetical protein HMPREF9336_03330 [Segniliparus rugosus ATCC BAA-974]|uniref:Oxidoreductase molybdopterin-binding domain-containing protein n=2 Tax=Segniliparus rugosus TaxID=286804 RepID=E5XV08_SEGRC|nr:hypothetical protein HMPREF9336_03330 [Segniliparus rugosus ATCC BAA-974]
MAAALATSFFTAAALGAAPAPFPAVGSVVVDFTPPWLREWVVGQFGTSDKTVLFVCLGATLAALGALAGFLERPRLPLGSSVFLLCGALGYAAVWAEAPQPGWRSLFAPLSAVIVGVTALRFPLGLLRVRSSSEPGGPEGVPLSRRAFAASLMSLSASGAVLAFATTKIDRLRSLGSERAATLLPRPTSPAPSIPNGATAPEAVPFVTSVQDFYRIDTALATPALSREAWRLKVFGMVANPLELTWADLAAMPMIERAVTLTCVSNEVGGDLIGNAVWSGVPMALVLAEAGPLPDADMLLSRSVDGWTAGTPLSAVRDGRDAMLAVGMNGEPLPFEHGYPVRQVVPGLYGYVSATKWVIEWEITRFDRSKAYWSTRGWSERGPIKLSSRLERPGGSVRAGRVVVAGSAWAQHVGISKVEVRVDDGPWQEARLADEYSADTWRQWWFDWAAEPGNHTIACRAYDREGRVQDGRRSGPAPDGATGWHEREIQVV